MDVALLGSGGVALVGVVLTLAFLPKGNAAKAVKPSPEETAPGFSPLATNP
jgi:hypothetical protein